jgi:endogenous inhibitor of DNA gyrase (YacG/DUF329 family)
MAKEMQRTTQFFICRTCGKYIPVGEMLSGGYCSSACITAFNQCITCGRYVPREEIHDTYFCSAECSQHYTFLKTMGPRPVIIASDQSTNDYDDILI